MHALLSKLRITRTCIADQKYWHVGADILRFELNYVIGASVHHHEKLRRNNPSSN